MFSLCYIRCFINNKLNTSNKDISEVLFMNVYTLKVPLRSVVPNPSFESLEFRASDSSALVVVSGSGYTITMNAVDDSSAGGAEILVHSTPTHPTSRVAVVAQLVGEVAVDRAASAPHAPASLVSRVTCNVDKGSREATIPSIAHISWGYSVHHDHCVVVRIQTTPCPATRSENSPPNIHTSIIRVAVLASFEVQVIDPL